MESISFWLIFFGIPWLCTAFGIYFYMDAFVLCHNFLNKYFHSKSLLVILLIFLLPTIFFPVLSFYWGIFSIYKIESIASDMLDLHPLKDSYFLAILSMIGLVICVFLSAYLTFANIIGKGNPKISWTWPSFSDHWRPFKKCFKDTFSKEISNSNSSN